MIQQTKEFPMILAEVIIKKTTVMAKAADVDIMKFNSRAAISAQDQNKQNGK